VATATVGSVLVVVALALAANHGDESPPATKPPASTAAPSTTNPPRVVFHEEFSAPGRWFIGEDDAQSTSLVEGQYRILNKRPNLVRRSTIPVVAPGSIRIEVDANKTSTAPGTFGLTCRAGSDGTEYRAALDTDGSWTVYEYSGSAVPLTLARGSASGATPIVREGVNHLLFECDDPLPSETRAHLTLSVNGRQLTQVQASGNLKGTNAHLIVTTRDQPNEVLFDNIVVTRL
jgi:hypothetical protein